jgi:hypothetical protein
MLFAFKVLLEVRRAAEENAMETRKELRCAGDLTLVALAPVMKNKDFCDSTFLIFFSFSLR